MERKAYIKQIDYYLPVHIVKNEDIVADFPEWSVEKIAQKVGVNKRHVASESLLSSFLLKVKFLGMKSIISYFVLKVLITFYLPQHVLFRKNWGCVVI